MGMELPFNRFVAGTGCYPHDAIMALMECKDDTHLVALLSEHDIILIKGSHRVKWHNFSIDETTNYIHCL